MWRHAAARGRATTAPETNKANASRYFRTPVTAPRNSFLPAGGRREGIMQTVGHHSVNWLSIHCPLSVEGFDPGSTPRGLARPLSLIGGQEPLSPIERTVVANDHSAWRKLHQCHPRTYLEPFQSRDRLRTSGVPRQFYINRCPINRTVLAEKPSSPRITSGDFLPRKPEEHSLSPAPMALKADQSTPPAPRLVRITILSTRSRELLIQGRHKRNSVPIGLQSQSCLQGKPVNCNRL